MKLGPMIRAARHAHAMSLEELGKRCRASASYLCRIENGDRSRRASARLLARIAETLDLDVDLVFVAADRVPADLVKWILDTPEALPKLRKMQRAAA